MNDELARELKDAGFPQERFAKGRFSVPTLEALIEACGTGFDALSREEPDRWVADPSDGMGYSCSGSTPAEAVARLWLSINDDEQSNYN